MGQSQFLRTDFLKRSREDAVSWILRIGHWVDMSMGILTLAGVVFGSIEILLGLL